MNRRTLTATALAAVCVLGLAGCGAGSSAGSDKPDTAKRAPHLKVTGSYMPQPVTDKMAGAFLTVENTGGADKLTSVTSDLSDDVSLHTTKGNAMEHVSSLPVPADGALKLASGGDHIMFMGLKHKPAEGEKVTVQLHFAKADAITVQVPVKSATYRPGDAAAKHDGDMSGMDHSGMDHSGMDHSQSAHK
ncbi:copper chaperone PCu(A)C [Streptomyces ramulosus]|uniref:copper chaperone PCu(A)C n=1 Tax=Streptomyces sp. NPDC000404 TaxID=3154253 RepID=UPI0031EDFC4B